MSVRLESRTADNQLDYLLGLFGEIFAKYPDALCVLDGFSFPIGFSRDAHMNRYRVEFSRRASLTAEFISELQNQAAAIFGARIMSQLCSISGLSLAEAVSVGSLCDYYICHAGTLQHKIAWLHNTPGFIHSPPIGDGYARPRWYADQVEGGLVPDILAAR